MYIYMYIYTYIHIYIYTTRATNTERACHSYAPCLKRHHLLHITYHTKMIDYISVCPVPEEQLYV